MTTMTTTMTPKNAATMITAREKSGCSDKGNNDDGGNGKAKGCSSGKTGCPKNAATMTTMIPKNSVTMTTLITAS